MQAGVQPLGMDAADVVMDDEAARAAAAAAYTKYKEVYFSLLPSFAANHSSKSTCDDIVAVLKAFAESEGLLIDAANVRSIA